MPSDSPLYRTALACRLAGVDRAWFNDAVSKNHFPCVPLGTAGATRLFNDNDLLALFCFGTLHRLGLSLRQAGSIACTFKREVDANDQRARKSESIVFALLSEGQVVLPSPPPGTEGVNANYFTKDLIRQRYGLQVLFTLEFHIEEARTLLRERFQQERRIHGTD